MAEMTPWMNLGESSAQAGMLCWQDVVYTEVCDPQTNRRLPFGSEGTPVYTHLERTSQPMIRLQSGDLTRWEAGPSPCGRTYPLLPKGIYGRIDDMFTIRGENVYPAAIDEVLTALPDYGGEHRIFVSRDETMDELAVRAEHEPDADARPLPGARRRRRCAPRSASPRRGRGAAEHVRAHRVQGAPRGRRAGALPRDGRTPDAQPTRARRARPSTADVPSIARLISRPRPRGASGDALLQRLHAEAARRT